MTARPPLSMSLCTRCTSIAELRTEDGNDRWSGIQRGTPGAQAQHWNRRQMHAGRQEAGGRAAARTHWRPSIACSEGLWKWNCRSLYLRPFTSMLCLSPTVPSVRALSKLTCRRECERLVSGGRTSWGRGGGALQEREAAAACGAERLALTGLTGVMSQQAWEALSRAAAARGWRSSFS